MHTNTRSTDQTTVISSANIKARMHHGLISTSYTQTATYYPACVGTCIGRSPNQAVKQTRTVHVSRWHHWNNMFWDRHPRHEQQHLDIHCRERWRLGRLTPPSLPRLREKTNFTRMPGYTSNESRSELNILHTSCNILHIHACRFARNDQSAGPWDIYLLRICQIRRTCMSSLCWLHLNNVYCNWQGSPN